MVSVCKGIKLFTGNAMLPAFLFLNFCNLYSQSIVYENNDFQGYKIGIMASPNGIGPFYRNFYNHDSKFAKVFDIGLTGIKSIKEKSVLNQRMANATPYIYGKVNRLYALRPMFGLQKLLSERISKNGIGINGFACMGPTFGFLKPVYVDVETVDPNIPNSFIVLSKRYDPSVIPNESISGYSSFNKGLSHTKMVLGISLKVGVEFNWGLYSSGYKSLEMGFMADIMPSRPEIMAISKNKLIYSSFYISFALGEIN
jgi:hypothetical protein